MLESLPPAKSGSARFTGHRTRILIADDHLLFAEGCKSLLEPEFHVVGIVSDGRMLVKSEAMLQPDIVILDISMPGLNGLDAGEQIKTKRRDTKLIYVTMDSDPDIAAEAFRRGASGYLLKHGDSGELRTAVRTVLRGQSYLSSLLNKEDIAMRVRLGAKYHQRKTITGRQIEILRLLAEGKAMKEIAWMLKIKPGTVAFHKYRMMESLGIKTNAALMDYAVRNKHALDTARSGFRPSAHPS
jgi:DNA-binding NarL/FixJ family response regulator